MRHVNGMISKGLSTAAASALLAGVNVALSTSIIAAPPPSNDASRLVDTRIAIHHFRIPKAYLWNRADHKGGQLSGVNLEALLPRLDHRNRSNEAEFRAPGWGRKVVILVSENRGKLTSSRFLTTYMRNAMGPAQPGPFGYEIYTLKESKTSTKELFVKSKEDGSKFFLYCALPGALPFPSCSGVFDYGREVYVRFTFSRNFLSQGEGIADEVRELIKSFEVR